MLTALWSAKGGAGTTTVAVAIAAASDAPVLLVDLGGDVPAATGMVDPELGLTDWLASEADPAGLVRLEVPMRRGMVLLPTGSGAAWADERAALLIDLLRVEHREVLVDLGAPVSGPVPGSDSLGRLREQLVEAADRSVLVTRACYLALRRAARVRRPPDSAVLVCEPGRALDRADVEGLLGAPVVAEVDLDPAVARALDAGLLLARAPRHLLRSLRELA